MSRDDIYNNLCQAIYTVQEWSGEKKTKINGETRLFSDLPSFDSLRAIEVIAVLSDLLNWNMNGEVDPFVSGGKALQINEIVDRIYDSTV